jgi:hypothetical protein
MTYATVVAKPAVNEARGFAYCPICTHTVETNVLPAGRRQVVKPGEKCPRCGSPIDVAAVLRIAKAA